MKKTLFPALALVGILGLASYRNTDTNGKREAQELSGAFPSDTRISFFFNRTITAL